MQLHQMTPPMKAKAREILRKEFTDFLVTMTTESADWPNVSDQELINALADSLMELGKRKNMGAAFVQTLVIELQDRVTTNLN